MLSVLYQKLLNFLFDTAGCNDRPINPLLCHMSYNPLQYSFLSNLVTFLEQIMNEYSDYL